MVKNHDVSTIPPSEDRILPFSRLGNRWYCHPKVAAKRAKELGLEIVRFNSRALGVRLSDVLRVEREATV
jgi:hypothetical protein